MILIMMVFFSVGETYSHSWNHSLNIVYNKALNKDSVFQKGMRDVVSLLENAEIQVTLNEENSTTPFWELQTERSTNSVILDSAVLYEDFSWVQLASNGAFCKASTPKGLINGLYAMLQEKMGFYFYHARNTSIPNGCRPTFVSFDGKKAFDKIGFHVHTMHPLEITECLLDANFTGGLACVKEYIDWLARNGQNYFEFNLLESIDRDTWLPHAKAITDYAHQRGIFCGADLSLHMLQQKAFQLYQSPPASLKTKEKQLEQNAEWLIQAGFDVWNVELSATEFSAGDMEEKSALLEILNEILSKNGVKLMSRKHVVKADKMVSGKTENELLTKEHGLMIHTVMFYSLLDENAPVYENDNLLHMRDLLLKEMEQRETWYFPETAYWVTFDLSVPMLLLPYLQARLEDIEYCDSLQKIDGHLTFTSGWEWGNWLFDWSVARWSWNYMEDGVKWPKEPLQYAKQVIENEAFEQYFVACADAQQTYIKDKDLIKVLVAQTVTDEMPGKFNIEFHPRPEYPYPYIRNSADSGELAAMNNNYLIPLKEFIQKSKPIYDNFQLNPMEEELYWALKITGLRAEHKYNTLSYLVQHRLKDLGLPFSKEDYMLRASLIRENGLAIVDTMEKKFYRYPLSWVAEKRVDHTCYHFGYLYPVHQLHFWEREELQAVKNKYKFWYRSIWNIPRTIGLVN